ncbi:hypothetical protein [Blastococcus carthaginiensis]|uniref:hypothetical protein n=1 Tax=Blastococcus carthaginiensis TaxID=3050034 RepID=UPI00273F1152|nr:hypothetical protein [Blastococcus carthaginiensis]
MTVVIASPKAALSRIEAVPGAAVDVAVALDDEDPVAVLASTNSGSSGMRTITVTQTENSSPGTSAGEQPPAASQPAPVGA